MRTSSLKSESARIIFNSKLKTVIFACLAAFYASNAFAEDVESWDPVPSFEYEEMQAGQLEKSQTAVHFEGAKNKPPYDLTIAKQCEEALKSRQIAFNLMEAIADERGCIVERPLNIQSLSKGISLSREMTLRCEVVLAMDDWINNIVRPSSKLYFQQDLKSLKTSTSYHCRTRNNKPGGKISEHGFANGVDITGFELENETVIQVSSNADNLAVKANIMAQFRAAVRAGACAYFTTVLGPGSDGSHQDHFHFDLAYRKSGYRLCE